MYIRAGSTSYLLSRFLLSGFVLLTSCGLDTLELEECYFDSHCGALQICKRPGNICVSNSAENTQADAQIDDVQTDLTTDAAFTDVQLDDAQADLTDAAFIDSDIPASNDSDAAIAPECFDPNIDPDSLDIDCD